MCGLKVECTRIDTEVSEMREIIIQQQKQIEKQEEKPRENNLIAQNISEKEIVIGSKKLSDDVEKLSYICDSSNICLTPKDIAGTQRLGKRQDDKPRPLKILLKSKEKIFGILNKRKNIHQNGVLSRNLESRIFFNPETPHRSRRRS